MGEKKIDSRLIDQQKELAQRIDQFCKEDGIHSTAIPSLHFIRASERSEPIHSIHEPAVCIVVQGSKLVMLAQDDYQYNPAHYLVVSVDLPISGEIIEASPDKPYLCLRLDFAPQQIVNIISESEQTFAKKADSKPGLFVSKMHGSLLDAVLRLVQLLDTPEDLAILSPLIIREILYRILHDKQGDSVKQIAVNGGPAQRIGKVIEHIKKDYVRTLRIDELAQVANMSASSLHYHFKKVTRLSPIQYQKQLRLQEARRLMLLGELDAANAGFSVGYESPSQFSREYSRMFGMPPIKDINRLQEF
ncbi:AraC family transcriptional regulator [Gracilibacillus oryzae]|uniref:AraC family transcriptional regulator n=1 Tax=Gracilibacillus oryzae TaxID=1672701 RepID=A0A7C8KR62_9BACI|nr:AraC family transcriptional regulator [Gracilibacillus oryzae]KAB8125837.1 AraC family transcriptional regulator [Gracilibacillus oryzae]